MRIIDIILETPNLDKIKHEIITGVKNTHDPNLLEKIRAALYSESLSEKIHRAFSDEQVTVQKNLDHIIHTIMKLPGLDVEGKIKFAKGLKDGYINVNKMLSGKRVSFKGLIQAPKELHSFAVKFFNELYTYQPKEKGPAEFALAVMSPHISIEGKGDLKIGDEIIEVKGSTSGGGGSIGEANLSYEELPNIFEKYGIDFEGKTASLANLVSILKSNPNIPVQEFATEFWHSVFKTYPEISLDDLIEATVSKNRQKIDHEFVDAAFVAYQGGEKKKFNQLMLIKQKSQELQVFKNAKDMKGQITAVDATFMGDKVSRQIVPRTNLSRIATKKPETLKKAKQPRTEITPELQDWIGRFVDYFISKNQEDADLKPQLISKVSDYLLQGISTTAEIDSMLQNEIEDIRASQPAPDASEPATVAPVQQPTAPQTELPVSETKIVKHNIDRFILDNLI